MSKHQCNAPLISRIFNRSLIKEQRAHLNQNMRCYNRHRDFCLKRLQIRQCETSMYRQFNERAGISIEQDTANVPNDGKYYVLKDGEIVANYKNLKAANEMYRKLVEDKGLPPLEPLPKLTREQLLERIWDERSTSSLLNKKPIDIGKKSGRFHKPH